MLSTKKKSKVSLFSLRNSNLSMQQYSFCSHKMIENSIMPSHLGSTQLPVHPEAKTRKGVSIPAPPETRSRNLSQNWERVGAGAVARINQSQLEQENKFQSKTCLEKDSWACFLILRHQITYLLFIISFSRSRSRFSNFRVKEPA